MEEQRSEVSILALSSAVSSLHRGRAGGKLAGQLEELRASSVCRSRLLAESQWRNRQQCHLVCSSERSSPSEQQIGRLWSGNRNSTLTLSPTRISQRVRAGWHAAMTGS
ncbi:unnamed protein product [Symbiodinium sp. KB8]|nr:unnamed protein product [Symbiodinium sp. KB8]